MPRPSSRHPTELELEILQNLWNSGPLTIRQIQAGLAPERVAAYTTIATMLSIMMGKGLVRREREGQSARYAAEVDQRDCQGGLVRDAVDRWFGGSVSAMVQQLIETSDLNAEELSAIRQLIERQSREPSE